MSDTLTNAFTKGPLGAIYLKTALPIIFVMGMNGLLAAADALFLGHYVGPEALAAVTLVFPIYMLIVKLSTQVASGRFSLVAHHLGGELSFGSTQGALAWLQVFGRHGLCRVRLQ